MEEEKLNYGSVSSPVKIGNTVHRQAGTWTPTIHALLQFLNQNGFAFAPRAIGMDGQGREILDFLPGKAATRPWPTVLLTSRGLMQAAKMLREYHDAVQDFTPPSDAEWRIGKIDKKKGQIIRHGDLGPWNTLWQGNTLTGLIDWDLAEPGERVTDLAQMAYYFAPLRCEEGWQKAGFSERPDFKERLHILCAAYGDFKTDEVIAELLRWLDSELRRVRELGQKGREPWASFLHQGDDAEIVADMDWIKENQKAWGL